MRVTISKSSSTKPERIFLEILKRNRIPFRHRVKLDGKEIDFIVGKYAIEIDGHTQNASRNAWLFSKGYTPLHYSNNSLRNNIQAVESDIINKYVIFI